MLSFVIRRLGAMRADHAVPDAGRLLPDQSRTEPEEAGDQPDRDARHGRAARKLARHATAIARTSSSATASGSASCRSSRTSIRRRARPCRGSQFCQSRRCRPISGVLAGRFRLLDQVQDQGFRQAVSGARRHRHPDVLGDGDDGPDRAAGRHPGRHARGVANRPNAVSRVDRHHRDAGICLRRHLHGDLRLVARHRSTVRPRRRRAKASASTISRCRS